MDYSKATTAKNLIDNAIKNCDTLIGQLTEAILQTSVGSIATLQEKITELKGTLDAASSAIQTDMDDMVTIEAGVKG